MEKSSFDETMNAYKAVALEENWEEMRNHYTTENPLALSFSMTVNRDNAIHMAVHSNRKQPLEHFLGILENAGPDFPMDLISEKNALGNTPLHKAASVGNYEAAKLLAQKRRPPLVTKNKRGETPLFKAAASGHTKVMKFLAEQPGQKTRDGKLEEIHRYRKISGGEHEDTILNAAIKEQHFGTALALLEMDQTLAFDTDKSGTRCLQLLASIPHAFRSAYQMAFWDRILYFCLPVSDNNYSDDEIDSIIDYHVNKMEEVQERPKDSRRGAPVGDQQPDVIEIFIDDDDDDNRKASKTIRFWRFLFQVCPNMRKIWRQKRMNELALKLAKMLIDKDYSWTTSFTKESRENWSPTEKSEGQESTANKHDKQAPAETNKLEKSKARESSGQSAGGENKNVAELEVAFLIAAKNGIIEIVEEMLRVHPQAIEHSSHKGQNILHVVVLHRQEKIFNIVKKMRIPIADLARQIDKEGYTILHCAAEKTKYYEGTRPGPAYQLQDEIKWFERVYKLVPPHFGMHRDNDSKTAKERFDEQHNEQLKEARTWIKETAQSCSAVTVLLATVVFAAAYTVPGGSNERGLPIFLYSPIFLFFTIMDVISLAASLTAVVTFLSILSSPLVLSNFHKMLPRRLAFGFTLLFVSVVTAMLAFTATILLVIHLDPRRWTSTLMYTAAFLPVGMLALTQFPLCAAFMDTLVDIFKAIRKILPSSILNPRPINLEE